MWERLCPFVHSWLFMSVWGRLLKDPRHWGVMCTQTNPLLCWEDCCLWRLPHPFSPEVECSIKTNLSVPRAPNASVLKNCTAHLINMSRTWSTWSECTKESENAWELTAQWTNMNPRGSEGIFPIGITSLKPSYHATWTDHNTQVVCINTMKYLLLIVIEKRRPICEPVGVKGQQSTYLSACMQ